ncbi:MAG: hypothetical protein ACOYXC_01365 [Candidatus Rifleibacteriota bacterium]
MRRLKTIVVVLILLIFAAVIAWNNGPVKLDEINETYYGTFYDGKMKGQKVNYLGVKLFQNWMETRTRPDRNPLNIIWQHFWYNCIYDGHESVFWVSPQTVTASRNYAIYFTGNTIFLRVEYDGWNQVLKTEFSPRELEFELSRFTSELPAEE